jgi:hypothetical protein
MHEIQFSSICANKGGHREIKFAGSDAPAAEESRRSLFLAARTPPLAGSSDERRAAMDFQSTDINLALLVETLPGSEREAISEIDARRSYSSILPSRFSTRRLLTPLDRTNA